VRVSRKSKGDTNAEAVRSGGDSLKVGVGAWSGGGSHGKLRRLGTGDHP
jgi:hypothetical protein